MQMPRIGAISGKEDNMKNAGNILKLGILLLVLLAVGNTNIGAGAVKNNPGLIIGTCIVLAVIFGALKIAPLAIFFIAIPVLALVGWVLTSIWAAICGWWAALGLLKQILLGVGLVAILLRGGPCLLRRAGTRSRRRRP